MSKPRVIVTMKDEVRQTADFATLIKLLVRGTKGFFSKAQLMATNADGTPAFPWHAYQATADSRAAATEPVDEGTYWVINIDEDEAGMVGVIEQMAEATVNGIKAVNLDNVEFDFAPNEDKMLANVFGIVPVPVDDEV